MNKKVLLLVGMPGAGKSSCIDHVVESGIPKVYFGGVVVNETLRRYGKTTEEKEKLVREEMRQKDGKAAIALKIIPEITKLFKKHDRVVADGLYSWTEYKLFKEMYGENAIVVAVTAPRHLRHQRLANRPIRPFTKQEANSRDYSEIEFIEKGGPIANADYTLVNDGDPYDLINKLDQILRETKFI